MTRILVDARIFLRKRFEPHDVGSRSPHDDIEMIRSLCECVDVVAEHVRLGEKDLDDMLRLAMISERSTDRTA